MRKTNSAQKAIKRVRKTPTRAPKIKGSIKKVSKAIKKATIKDQWDRELKKAKERAKLLPEGWTVQWPKAPKTQKQLEKKLEGLKKVSIKNLRYGKLPKYVTFQQEVEFNGKKWKTKPITSQKYREIYRLKKQDVERVELGEVVDFDDFKPHFLFTSDEGLKRYIAGLRKRSSKKWMSEKDKNFKDNFIKSMNTIKEQVKGSLNSSNAESRKVFMKIYKAAETAERRARAASAHKVAYVVQDVLGSDTLLYNKVFGSSQYKIGEFDVSKLIEISRRL